MAKTTKSRAKATRPKKKPAKTRRHKIDLEPVAKTLTSVKNKLKRLTKTKPDEITEDHVNEAKDIAAAIEESVRGLKEAIKRAAMADGKLKPGQTMKSGGRLVYLKLRPGAKEGSTNPDDYDLVAEQIH